MEKVYTWINKIVVLLIIIIIFSLSYIKPTLIRIVLDISLVLSVVIFGYLIKSLIKKKLLIKLNNCEINDYIKSINVLLNYEGKKSFNINLCLSLANCYILVNDLESAKRELEITENIFHKGNCNMIDRFSYLNILYYLFMTTKDDEKAKKVCQELLELKSNVLMDKLNNKDRKIIEKYYNYLELNNNRKSLSKEDNANKQIEYWISYSKCSDTLLSKVDSSYHLIPLYEKIGNKEKAEDYAKYVLENHKDFYLDPTIMDKYRND